jgi:hypothetical protein
MNFSFSNLMFHLVVRHQLLLTTLTIFTHMLYVHITPILIIIFEIVHPMGNFRILLISK